MVVRSPSIAAVLSFVVPGLGQASVGARRRAALIAIPALATVALVLGAVAAGPRELVDLLLQRDVLLALLILNVALGAYHLLAIVDAYRIAGRRRVAVGRSRLGLVVVGLLLVTTVGIHGGAEWVGLDSFSTLDAVFPGGDQGIALPEPSFEPSTVPSAEPGGSPSASPSSPASAEPGIVLPTLVPFPALSPSPGPNPAPSPSAAPVPAWAKDGRLDLLLIGADSGPDRWSLRTDTMIVLSVDVATGHAALFGIPRNMTGVPVAPEDAAAVPNGRFPGLLNALYVYAMGHPSQFPGGDARGFRAVGGAVQELLGVRIDGMVVVNLAGFVGLVDQIGGLWVDVPERLVDTHYPLEDGSGLITIDIKPGCQEFDGRMALAYARSRHQDSDYGRMERQQRVLVALRRQFDPLTLLPKFPKLLSILRDDVWTTIARSDVAGLARLAARVDPDRVRTTLFAPSRYSSHVDDAEIAAIRSVVRTVFQRPPPPASAALGGVCP